MKNIQNNVSTQTSLSIGQNNSQSLVVFSLKKIEAMKDDGEILRIYSFLSLYIDLPYV